MTHDDILTVEDELRHAMLTNDVAALDRLIDDDLVFTAIDGSIATKQMDLDAHRARLLRATKLEPVEMRTGQGLISSPRSLAMQSNHQP